MAFVANSKFAANSPFRLLGFFTVFPFSFSPFLFGEQFLQGSELCKKSRVCGSKVRHIKKKPSTRHESNYFFSEKSASLHSPAGGSRGGEAAAMPSLKRPLVGSARRIALSISPTRNSAPLQTPELIRNISSNFFRYFSRGIAETFACSLLQKKRKILSPTDKGRPHR